MTASQNRQDPVSRVARHKRAYRVQAVLATLMGALVTAAVLFLVFSFWLVPVRMAGDSMAPTLQNGEVVLVDRAAKFWKTPSRGDVVAFYDPATGGLLLRRIVALEGELVDVKDGRVYIDGCPLGESDYLPGETPAADSDAVTVPQGTVYVLSDDRAYNGDSRDSTVGCVPYSAIRGVLRMRLLPAERIAFFA